MIGLQGNVFWRVASGQRDGSRPQTVRTAAAAGRLHSFSQPSETQITHLSSGVQLCRSDDSKNSTTSSMGPFVFVFIYALFIALLLPALPKTIIIIIS